MKNKGILELKALAYDMIVQREQRQRGLMALNEQIGRLAQEIQAKEHKNLDTERPHTSTIPVLRKKEKGKRTI